MLDNIIKEEIEEDEENISEIGKINDEKNQRINNNNENNSILSSKAVKRLSLSIKDSENNISELSEDILPIIYSKYRKQYEKTKNKALITSSNLNLNEEDDEKRTILHRACLQIKLRIIKDLESKLTNIYVNKLDKYGNSPLILACKLSTNESKDREEILEILIKFGANVHCIEPINGWTALHWCCFNGDLPSVKLLIKYGANFFLPSRYGFFTIDLAGKRLFYNLVSYLIKIATKYLQKIGDYELLDIDNILTDNIIIDKDNNMNKNEINNDNIDYLKKAKSLGNIITLDNKKKKTKKKEKILNNNNNSNKMKSGNIQQHNKSEVVIDLSQLPKINQTIYLRLFTEHCLYWACFFNYKETTINMFLSLYNARPAFPLFSLENRTSLHAACTQGSVIPFQLVYKTYEIKRKKKLEEDKKSAKKVPVSIIKNGENNLITTISYPKEFNQYKRQLLDDEQFNKLNKNFRNYIINNFFELIYPKTLIEKLPLNQILDKDGNNPITLACKYNNEDFIQKLKENNIVDNIFNEMRLDNKLGFSGYYYLKNVDFRRKFIEESGNKIAIPLVVLELNKNRKTISTINLIVKIARNEGLKVSLMQHIDYSKIYILVDISEELFFEQCVKEKMEMKLLDKNLFLKFENNKDFINSIEPFLSRHYQYIIVKCISNCIDIDMLKNQKILNQIFLTHIPITTSKIYHKLIKRPFYSLNPICFFFDYFGENKNCKYSHIKLLYNYFGESISMFYAFYSYLTIMYSPLFFVSIGYAISYRASLFTSQDIYPTFFIIFAFWNMFM